MTTKFDDIKTVVFRFKTAAETDGALSTIKSAVQSSKYSKELAIVRIGTEINVKSLGGKEPDAWVKSFHSRAKNVLKAK